MSLSGVLNMRHNRNLYRPCSAGCHPSLRLFAPQISRKITLRTWFFSSLLVALGAVRIVTVTILAQSVVSIGVLVFGPFRSRIAGVQHLAIIPLGSLLSLAVVRHFLKFDWLELVATTARSAVATLTCAVGPLAIILTTGGLKALSTPLAIVAAHLLGSVGSPGCG
jgi:hypothetical protein